jgi:hypothetical protein
VERHKKGLYQQKEDEKAPVVEKVIVNPNLVTHAY